MSQALALRFESDRVAVVVAQSANSQLKIDAVVEVPLEQSDGEGIAKRLSDALAPYRGHRLPLVLAISRDDLQWQSYELPPTPAEELPEMVQMQAARDFPISEDGVGLDFLPLSGGDEQVHRVLTIGMGSERLKKRLDVCEEAGLQVRRVTAECLGWPSLMKRQLLASDGEVGVSAGLAVARGHAEIWACRQGEVKLVRSVHLPVDASVESRAAVLNGELRRTLMALSNLEGQPAIQRLHLYGAASPLIQQLSSNLPIDVEPSQLESLIEAPDESIPLELIDVAPMAALAADEADGVAPPIDLLNPRRPPEPPSRIGVYGLAGCAAALLAALIGWRMYRNVQGPLEAAEDARYQTEALAETLASFEEDQSRVDQINRWLERSVELLPELESLALQTRVEPLDAEQFPAEQDVVIQRVEFDGPMTTLRGVARNAGAVQPFETRLRQSSFRVDRGAVNPNDKTLPGYEASFEAKLERVDQPTAQAGS